MTPLSPPLVRSLRFRFFLFEALAVAFPRAASFPSSQCTGLKVRRFFPSYMYWIECFLLSGLSLSLSLLFLFPLLIRTVPLLHSISCADRLTFTSHLPLISGQSCLRQLPPTHASLSSMSNTSTVNPSTRPALVITPIQVPFSMQTLPRLSVLRLQMRLLPASKLGESPGRTGCRLFPLFDDSRLLLFPCPVHLSSSIPLDPNRARSLLSSWSHCVAFFF